MRVPPRPPRPGTHLNHPLQFRWAPASGALTILTAAVLLVGTAPILSPAQDPPKQEPEKKAAAPAAPAPGGATYAGSETCQACHEDIFKAFQRNRHVLVETAGKYSKWNKQACESCHGPGSKHAESTEVADIINPAKLPSGAADKSCLTCHLNTPTQAGRVHGGHANSAVSCTACHSIHGAPKKAALDCTACHSNTWAQFNRPFGHTVVNASGGNGTRRGHGMVCTDCHTPHGGVIFQSVAARSFRALGANEPGCFRCHGDKRGPFVYEHAPMRTEGCAACHEPHNSSNPRMLNRPQVHLTCLECHSNIGQITPTPSPDLPLGGVPPGFHDLSNPRFRQCTICHVKVHGSQVNRDLLR